MTASIRVRCPRCGRTTIDVRHYVGKNAGDVNYIHAQEPGIFGFILVTENCYVAARDAKAAKP